MLNKKQSLRDWIIEYAENNAPYLPRKHYSNIETREQLDEIVKKYLIHHNVIYKTITSSYREHGAGYKQRFHRDNFRLDKNLWRRLRDIDPQQCWVPFEGPHPQVSVLWYKTTYNIDFKGGVLEFWDGEKIYPRLNDIYIFDSNDIHCVNTQTSGERRFYLIKYY